LLHYAYMTAKHYHVFETAYGWMGLAGSQAGISRLILPQPSANDVLTLLGVTKEHLDEDAFGDLPQRLQRYLDGESAEFPDKLDFHGATEFRIKVWRATQAIPSGQSKSYGWIADRIGRPNAARAVGQALGANPIPIIIPCHRVIAGDGGLGGVGGGIQMKKTLLRIEKPNEL